MYRKQFTYAFRCDRCNHYDVGCGLEHEVPEVPQGWSRKVLERNAEWEPCAWLELCRDCTEV